MPRKKDHKKYYLVKSKDKGYNYGAFPYSEEGMKDALKYVRRLAGGKENYVIEAK